MPGHDTGAIHAYLSTAAKEAWHKLAEDNGVSLTGLMEVIGADFARMIEHNGGDGDGLCKDWVKAARKVDAVRRRRGL